MNTVEAADVELPLDTQMPTRSVEEDAYGEDGKLTREGMERIIRETGGGVIYGNSIITRVEHLPTAAHLAAGDKKKQAAVAASLQDQIAALQAQLKLTEGGKAADLHVGDKPGIAAPDENVIRGTFGEGDTAGADGDRSDPDSPAGKKAAEEAKAAEDEAKAKAKANLEAEAEASKSKSGGK